ncbi:hypothetical protein UP10_26380 [Bradyrhizobium sp. LTSPM299]|jgi:transcriptional regulator with XRE-family HTH domain|uniref:hypothetical protein n=1 Tax=Bradyrhizobium sp. LTSPM299 TaxID=1619233 RepID=UPI0005CA266A|nr:hypothetical protein [Bradyrhizobium sp. LTSPM299]KJC57743.1 hypothetical protein UP10_26380 [Bradyrhizobium sp. LTSPM299]
MSTSQDKQIDQVVQERWRAIGLSQSDLAEVLCTNSAPASNGKNGAARIDDDRLALLAEVLGITADVVSPQAAASAQVRAGIQAARSLQSLLELRMLRVFREVQNPDTKRILIELAEQIVKRQTTSPGAG